MLPRTYLQFILVGVAFYGQAVRTGSKALQKLFYFIFSSFFLSSFAEKSLFSGVKFFFPDSSQERNGTPWPSFFDILASFGVKTFRALFREIE